MCGIVGFSGNIGEALLRQMNDVLVHRGPDDRGEYIDKEHDVGLAMRRLSIIDVAGGQQPMCNEDKTIWIVFNGEIYNSPSLRQELIDQGHRFKTDHSDTEVIIHLYEEYQEKAVSLLNGMFAFVIYDKRFRLLFGARDRMGIKPLYYALGPSRFLFASELKALLSVKDISREIDFQSLYDYMSFQFVPAPRSIFKAIKKLPAAHYFRYSLETKEFSTQRYWDLPLSSVKQMNVTEAIERIKYETERAVSEWSLSDVPIASSLSGGLDSSSVTGIFCRQGHNKLATFSLGFRHKHDKLFDERDYARNTAARWNTEHHETVLEPDALLEDLEAMIWHLDEPYAGGLPSWYIYKAMKGKVKVAMTGTGGDELFGIYGYWRPYENYFWRLREATKIMLFDNFSPRTLSLVRKFKQGYFYHRYFTENMKQKSVFSQDISKSLRPTEAYLQQLWDETNGLHLRDKVAVIHFKTQLPEEFLQMTDKFSMAHSIEARTPLLDHRLVEAAMSIPACIRTKPHNLKYLFRQAMRDVITDEVYAAPKKGFILPLDRWLRQPLRSEVNKYLGQEYLKKQNIFNPNLYHHIVKPYLSGKYYLKNCVWTALMFQLWHKQYQ